MKKGRNAAEKFEEFDDLELLDEELVIEQDRTLILKAAPPSRRVQLLAHGATDIRCSWCQDIKPLESAEEFEIGWICEECAHDVTPETVTFRTKGKVIPS